MGQKAAKKNDEKLANQNQSNIKPKGHQSLFLVVGVNEIFPGMNSIHTGCQGGQKKSQKNDAESSK